MRYTVGYQHIKVHIKQYEVSMWSPTAVYMGELWAVRGVTTRGQGATALWASAHWNCLSAPVCISLMQSCSLCIAQVMGWRPMEWCHLQILRHANRFYATDTCVHARTHMPTQHTHTTHNTHTTHTHNTHTTHTHAQHIHTHTHTHTHVHNWYFSNWYNYFLFVCR